MSFQGNNATLTREQVPLRTVYPKVDALGLADALGLKGVHDGVVVYALPVGDAGWCVYQFYSQDPGHLAAFVDRRCIVYLDNPICPSTIDYPSELAVEGDAA